MGDMGEYYRDMKELKSLHKRERVEEQKPFVDWLISVSVTWRHLNGNTGYRFNVPNKLGHHKTFDYWPSSGKWNLVGTRKYWQGEKSLRKEVEEWLQNEPN